MRPSEAAIDSLLDIQEDLPGANWSPPENIHLTLVFLGEQSRRALEDLDAALIGVDAPGFSLALQGAGAFGGRDARLAYAGVGESAPLRRLQAKVVQAARDAEIEVETRKYAPHVTVARWGRGGVSADRLAAYIERHSLYASPAFAVESFGLYRSELTRQGPHYELMADYRLRLSASLPREDASSTE